MLSRATAVTAEKERSSPSQALVHTLGGDVCVEGVPRAPPEPVHEGRQLRQSPSSISAKKLAEISGHRQRAREGSRHVNEVFTFFFSRWWNVCRCFSTALLGGFTTANWLVERNQEAYQATKLTGATYFAAWLMTSKGLAPACM